MFPALGGGVNGIALTIGPEAVVILSERPLLAVSSAPVGGGLAKARAVINLHVRKNDACLDPAGMLVAFARRAGVPEPYIGLLTGAWTDGARQATAARYGMEALVVATVGLSNRMAAGLLPGAVPCPPSTINTVVIVDADAEPAALVNAVITVTEVKARLLGALGICDGEGQAVTGTSTDAVVVAATGRGPRVRFGGPARELGWVVARAAGEALEAGIRHWLEANQ
jgi:adenosylcobinamide hydrolase